MYDCNALVICNHAPRPGGRVGDSRGNERVFDHKCCHGSAGEIPGVCFI